MSKANAIAVFDISSSSVGGAHALIQHDDDQKAKVTLLVQERRDTGLEEELNIDRFVNDTARALEIVIDHVRNADVHHPEFIQVVLASPWYSTHTRTINYNKNALFTCTQRLVDSLIEKEVAALLKQPVGQGFKVVEQQLSRITLNGYDTTDPYGKKVQAMELTVTITIVPEIVVERFSSILRRSYGDRTINVTTGPYATYVALRDNGGVPANCAIIDVGEEVTDVAFIKNNIFLYQHSFPLGTYELYRTVSRATSSTVEARALIEAYRLKKLTPSKTKLIEKSLQSFSVEWQQALQEVVEAGQYGFHFPSTCYVTADPRFEDFFTTVLSNDQFLRHNGSSDTVRAVFVDTIHLNAAITVSSAEQPDNSLAIAALFTDRLL